ncbi:class I adenylate-forming enzyme family protein [Cryptosporangium aurantiacum]|uniref:Fatty-acyl-CoA synthase n=1 Tax=Cryptosporangium aurantiacum TaxID=134849 RepID=A0A1M7KJY8_9ACTN|nr:class I adenylate-forming enzyme family protein [Cryptosporangium aurantiacum]SHM65590.1 fatty-acyl-CoA synthase [Cryptosporangium aurantiacum]
MSLSIASGPPLAEEPGLGTLTLPGLLRETTTRFAGREALVLREADGVIRWSYAELWDRAVTVARAVRASGHGKDSRVGVLMTNRPEWVSAVFGISLAGGVPVPLSTFSTPSELEYLLQTSGVSWLLFERDAPRKDFLEILTGLEPQIGTAAPGGIRSTTFPFLRGLAVVGSGAGGAVESWDDFLARGETEPAELVEATAETTFPSDAGLLLFSSGSTSKPKGILSAHRAAAIQCWRFARLFGLSPEDHVRCWPANGLFWSGNFAMALGATLCTGGSLVLQRGFDAAEALDLMHAERVTMPLAWPHQWPQLEAAPNWSDVDLSSLRFADSKFALAKHPTVSSDWSEPGHAYGNTETFTLTTCFPANTPPEVGGSSSGEPLPGVTVKIVDTLTAEVLPRGEHGEICVKGPTLMLGYVGTPLADTLDDEGFFRTGDGGRLDDRNRLFWEGRLTDIIKTGGANVSPLEVDEAIARYPGVKVTQTVGVPHETLGEVVVACIVPHDDAKLDADGIVAYLRERLASYKVPRHVLFFAEDEIALTGSAKVKSGDLRELAAKRLAG